MVELHKEKENERERAREIGIESMRWRVSGVLGE